MDATEATWHTCIFATHKRACLRMMLTKDSKRWREGGGGGRKNLVRSLESMDPRIAPMPAASPGLSRYVSSYSFSSGHDCESWTRKKAEPRRIDAFELWCWRRLLRDPWTARRSNQSILKEISPEYSLEGLMLKLKLQYFGYLMRRTDSLEKTLMLGKIEGRRRRG